MATNLHETTFIRRKASVSVCGYFGLQFLVVDRFHQREAHAPVLDCARAILLVVRTVPFAVTSPHYNKSLSKISIVSTKSTKLNFYSRH